MYGTKAVAPDAGLMAALLPAQVRLKRERPGNTIWLFDSAAPVAAYNPDYLSELTPGNAETARRDRPGELIDAFESDDHPLIANFIVIREAAAVVARIEGRRLADKLGSGTDFAVALPELHSIGSGLARLVCAGGTSIDSSVQSGIGRVVADLTGRFSVAASISFVFNAYGVGRAQYSAAETDRWPIQAVSGRLSLGQYPAFGNFSRDPRPMVEVLGAAGSRAVAGYEAGPWSLIRSFFWDSRSALAAQIPANLLPANQQWKQIPSIEQIAGTLAEMSTFRIEHHAPERLDSVKETRRAAILDDLAGHWARFDVTPPLPQVTSAVRPAAHPYGVSPRGAEFLCRDWMRFLGIADAEVTRSHADGGVDVTSSTHVAQVKHYTGSVGAPEVQQLVGVAHTTRREPIFFTSGKYTPAALAAAEAVDMPLIRYSAEDGTIEGENSAGARLVRFGPST